MSRAPDCEFLNLNSLYFFLSPIATLLLLIGIIAFTIIWNIQYIEFCLGITGYNNRPKYGISLLPGDWDGQVQKLNITSVDINKCQGRLLPSSRELHSIKATQILQGNFTFGNYRIKQNRSLQIKAILYIQHVINKVEYSMARIFGIADNLLPWQQNFTFFLEMW